MSGLLQRLAHRAMGGETGLSVHPLLVPRFAAVARDPAADASAESFGEVAPTIGLRPPADTRVARPRDPSATPTPALEPADATPELQSPARPGAEHGVEAIRSPASFRTTTTAAAPAQRDQQIEPREAVAAGAVDVTSASASPPPIERRLGWPPPTARDVSAPRQIPALGDADADRIVSRTAAPTAPDPPRDDRVMRTTRRSAPMTPDIEVGIAEAAATELATPRARAIEAQTETSARVGPRPPLSARDVQRPATAPRSRLDDRAAIPRGEENAPPTIHVTIGRIDVRAIPPAPAAAPAPARTPRLTLDEFLNQRSGRRQ